MIEQPFSGLVESKPQNVLSILAMLNARTATGVLRYEPEPEPEHVIELLMRGGRLLFATTNQPGARTAEFLVRHGVLSVDEASAALRDARRRGRLFHAALAERGLVQLERLQELLYLRVEELLHTVLGAEHGRLVLEQSDLRRFDGQVPTVDEHLFARLLIYRNTWPKAYAKLRAPGLVLRRAAGIEATSAFRSLSAAERGALDVVDGRQPLQRRLAGRKDRVEISVLLAQFLEIGLLETAEPEAVPEPPTRRVSDAAAEIHEAECASFDLDLIVALAPGTDLKQIPTTGLSMDDLFFLSQIDGRTSLRELISITGMGEKPLFRLVHGGLGHGFLELLARPVSGPPVRSIRRPSRVTSRPPAEPAGAPEPLAEAPAAPADPQEEAQRLHASAIAAYNAQSFAAAEELLRQALSLDEGSSRIRAHLALTLAELPGQMPEAERLAEEAFENDPLEALCLEALGLVKLRLGAYGPARRLLEKALLLDRRLVPSAARILDELRAQDPRKSGTAEKLWTMFRKRIQLKL
jgi:hypothetical protein